MLAYVRSSYFLRVVRFEAGEFERVDTCAIDLRTLFLAGHSDVIVDPCR